MDFIVHLIEHYGLLVIFLNVMLEEAGLPLPSYPVILVATATAMVGDDTYRVPAILLFGTAGRLAADLVWYGAARRYGRRILAVLCRLSLSPDSCVQHTEGMYARMGAASLVYTKFLPGLANVCVALAGIGRTSLTAFLALDFLGSAFYVGVAVILGILFRNQVAGVIEVLDNLGRYGVPAVLGLLAIYLLGRWWQRWLFIRQLRMDRITVDELMALLDEEPRPIILDVRTRQAREQDGMIPGAIGAHSAEKDPLVMSFSRDHEIVVYCACPNEATAATAAKHLKRAGFRKIRPLLGGIDAWEKAGQPVEKPQPPLTEAA